MMPMNILVTAASRRVPLVQAFQHALDALGLPGRVIATDVNAYSPAVHVADRAYGVPMATEPGYIDALLEICQAEGVRLVIPTIDDELPFFGAARERFRQAGVFAACSSEATAAACNDKYETCRHLTARGIPAADTYLPHELPASPVFPLFIKPRIGRGAVDAHVVQDARDLQYYLEHIESPIVQEYLSGPEFTIDVLCDPRGRPISIVPRERIVVRSGVIDRGRTVKSRALMELAERVCDAFVFTGALNIQCRMRGRETAVFEINPRFAGGIDLTIAAGADFPNLLVQMALGRRLMPRIGEFRDDLWICKYETAIFVQGSNRELPTLADVAEVERGLPSSLMYESEVA
jgi:carbamoyl-phosphate synthase large subunit